MLAAAAVLAAGCTKKNKYSHLADKPLPVAIEVVGESSKMVADTYVGEIRPAVDISLVFPLGGRLTGIYVKSGDKVKEGQVIATIDDTQAKALLESAEAMLNQAEDGYRRLKPVHDKGGLSDVKWVEMETNLEKARSMSLSARKRYEDCTLRAAQAGVVDIKSVDVGQHLAPNQRIGSLMDMSGYVVSFTVPESEIGRIKTGDEKTQEGGTPITVSLPALEKEYEAVVSEKSLTASHLAHTYKVKADILRAKGEGDAGIEDLLPGMICRAIVTNRESRGYIISASCVQTQQRGHSVWVVREGKAHKQMIKIADFVENGVLVSEGLQMGDTVISTGYQKMFEGAKVEW